MKVTNQLFPTEKHQLKAMQEKGPGRTDIYGQSAEVQG